MAEDSLRKSAREIRADLLEFVRRDLVGPVYGPEEVLFDPPRLHYAAGVLFPQGAERNESVAVGGIEEEVGSPDDADVQLRTDAPSDLVDAEVQAVSQPGSTETNKTVVETDYDDMVTLANTHRPSAIALSFVAEPVPAGLVVTVNAAVYNPERVTAEEGNHAHTAWRRHSPEIKPVVVPFPNSRSEQGQDLTPGLQLKAVHRPLDDGQWLITVSVYNSSLEHAASARTFFQVSLEIRAVDGSAIFPEFRGEHGAILDDEDRALALLYRKRRTFAIGHGCAAGWDDPGTGLARRIFSDTLPSLTVPPIVPLQSHKRYADMQFLGGACDRPHEAIPEALRELCDDYEQWIEERGRDATALEADFEEAAAHNLRGCRLAAKRMRAGIALLATNERVLDVFMLVNRVMLRQQIHSRLRRRLDDPWTALPTPTEYISLSSANRGYWRAFQIAFVLMVLPSLVSDTEVVDIEDEATAERDLVDLIWFPTGGGKTEAYLALTAFEIFWTRLEDPDRAGCRILMRYTLRLLTSQQFQRAASLICACELARREEPQRFGETPITIGLWVGMSLTPNDETEALRRLSDLQGRKEDARNPFQLLSCPWCGTELDNPTRLGYAERRGRQVFLCPTKVNGEERCPFGSLMNPLPVCVVDESIYAEPPTLIIGTVDKLAMLAWRERAGSVFHVGGGPELIIQDELHLISGPLGSIVGLYEGAIDFLCSRARRRPKIIASTATIRRAAEQCRALYDRRMFQFPPPGLDASDSFFAQTDPSDPGRLYVGFLPSAASSPLTAQLRSVTALQQGAAIVGAEADESEVDPYWTLVQYFSSLKELGRAATFVSADIPEFLPTMHRRYDVPRELRRWIRFSEELTSRKNEDEIPRILKRLEVKYRRGAEMDEQALDTVLATNMISVGVDIERLGLMMIVTQPKGTSEYIQASSRVGRTARGPGFVLTLYNAARPRDRSHYEQFRTFHGAFYRYVEPTSVTPFAPPAMERALHAIVIIGGRHVAGWKRPADLQVTDAKFQSFVEFLRSRVKRIDPEHLEEFNALIRERLAEWDGRRPEKWGDLSRSTEERTLMRVVGQPAEIGDPDGWETPTSMRNVDVECGAAVIGRYGAEGGDSA